VNSKLVAIFCFKTSNYPIVEGPPHDHHNSIKNNHAIVRIKTNME